MSIYNKRLDPKKVRHYYVDGSYNPHTELAASVILVKGWGIEPYTIVKQYRGKQISSTYAEHQAVSSAVEDAKEKGYDLTHVIIHTDQKGLVSGVGKLSKIKSELEDVGVRLKYLPSVHKVNGNSTKREVNAYIVGELAKKTSGSRYSNRYSVYFNKKKERYKMKTAKVTHKKSKKGKV